MTNRQFVRQHYPEAYLDYRVRPHNTMASTSFYQVASAPYGQERVILSKGKSREAAWRNAKINIKTALEVTP